MEEDIEILLNELQKRGCYNPWDVFNHPPDIDKSDDPKYHYKISIIKWNTQSTRVVNLAARWCDKQKRFIISTYKQGSTKRIKHNEKMRQLCYTILPLSIVKRILADHITNIVRLCRMQKIGFASLIQMCFFFCRIRRSRLKM
jgi:hypothetical protein